jgi:tRNA G26 N,N-dimethylase Trm1
MDALSGCGIRSLRFLTELNNVQYIVANDLYEDKTHFIEKNCKFNDVDFTKLKSFKLKK